MLNQYWLVNSFYLQAVERGLTPFSETLRQMYSLGSLLSFQQK